MNLSPDEKIALLKMEFPTLDLDTDDDVERYFELRKSGDHQAALHIYNTKLRRKFPDETTRIVLLRYYRANDPRYRVLLTQHIHQLADHFAVKVQNAVYFLTKDVETLDVSDAYAVIKTIEKIITLLAPERDMAPAAAEKFVTYADKIHFRQQLMRKTADLVRQYISESLDSVETLRQSIETRKKEQAAYAERAAVDARIRAKETAAARVLASGKKQKTTAAPQKSPQKKSIFDLSTITFSPADIARIEIPPAITRIEDKVLAYSLRFWPMVNNPAFERTVFLYSKKYNTKHFDIYNAIKIGRAQQRRDGDILTSVLGVLTTGYFYSVQGDRYLQIMWRRLHSGQDVPDSQPLAQETAPADDTAVQTSKSETEKKASLSPQRRKKNAAAAKKHSAVIPQKNAEKQKKEILPAGQKKRSALSESRTAAAKPHTLLQNSAQKPQKAASINKAAASAVIRKKQPSAAQSLAHSRFSEAHVAGDQMFTQSVADMIRHLSGRSYDVYKDVFLKTVRPYIRKVLASCRTTQHRLFDTSQNSAEASIFAFLEENYNNPFMCWQNSAAQKETSSLGFPLESLEHIIKLWYESNK